MPTDVLDAYLARCVQLSEGERQLFHAALKPHRLAGKSFLLREGEVCRYEAYVVKGCLRKYCIDDAGHEINLQFSVEDWWISDLASFTSRQPSALFIQALEDAELLLIEHDDKERLFQQIPALERMFRLMVQWSQAVLQDRFVSILTQPAEARYLAFLEKYPALPQRIPQQYIASYLGMTPEFLSKVRRRLAEK
jgi:CRP-like cAMP-binding protein